MNIWEYSAKAQIATVIIIAFILVIAGVSFAWILPLGKVSYSDQVSGVATTTIATTTLEIASSTPVFVVTHITTPQPVRAAYYTSWAAGTPSFKKKMFELIEGTELNSLVIDVKDYSGRISFPMNDPEIKKVGSVQVRIPEIKEMIGKLHEKGIYVIGRVAVFQDPFIVKVHPEWAVLDKRTGKQWKDSGGAYWADPYNKEMWKYTVAIAKEAYAVGFDEINFDYVRYPSDGALDSALFSKPASTTKAAAMKEFFVFVHGEMSALGIPTSADIFGQVTSDKGDMGIGQHFESVLPYFDYVSPMVYPSHYISGFLNYTKPAEHPYEVVKYEMDIAVARAIAASSSPDKIRPWLQAFDLGAVYTPAMVHTQMQATADAGANGWLLWNAGSVYNRAFVLPYVHATTTAKAPLKSL
ncbi:MAG: putative glycoside hydrolase [Candidatus Pacebacteria bacterium]|nr:putative glycoside hydrolase [Candidatus Paceibacterota bacterium]